MQKLILLLLLVLATTGCTRIEEAALSVPEKITRAFPPSAEVRAADERLHRLLASDPAALGEYQAYYTRRLELRGGSCTLGLSIGRFDSVAAVRELPVHRDCLDEQDASILRDLGIRQVGIRLAEPALRPFAPLGAPRQLRTSADISVYEGYAAAEAGVLLLRGMRGEFVAVEVPGGEQIVELGPLPGARHDVRVSPNGRLAAIHDGRDALRVVDLETGAALVDARGEFTRLLDWLPELSAAVAVAPGKGMLSLIDFAGGRIDAHPVPLRNAAWALSVSRVPSRMLIGSGRDIALIEHSRDAAGIKASVVREFRIKKGQGVTSLRPTLMQQGRAIVFVSGRDLMKLDLETGEETFWATGESMANRYAKLGETTLLVDTYVDAVHTKPWVLDIERETLAPVVGPHDHEGIVYNLDGRSGYLRRSSRVVVGDQIATADPEPLLIVMDDVNRERIRAREEAMARALSPARGLDTLPRQSVKPTHQQFVALAQGSRIEAVGVYEGRGAVHGIGKARRPGHVEVVVRKGERPVLLVLSSYEPVIWKIKTMPGAKLAGVMLSGYHDSHVAGAEDAPQLNIGAGYCHERAKCAALERRVEQLTGKGINAFQGRYQGNAFLVGGY